MGAANRMCGVMSDSFLLRKRFLQKYYSPPEIVAGGPELEYRVSRFWDRLERDAALLERWKKERKIVPPSVGVCYSCKRDVFSKNDFVAWRSGPDGGGWVCKRCVSRLEQDDYRRKGGNG